MRIKEGISAEEKSYKESGPDDLVLDAGHYTDTTPLIIYKESGQAKLLLIGSSDTTAYYQIDAGGWIAGPEISLSADGNAHKLTVWTKKGTDDSIKTVLYVQVKDALTTYKELKNVVKHAADSAVIRVKNEVTASTESGNNGEIVINKNITIQGTNKNSEILDAGSLSRIFHVKDGKALTLKNIMLTGGNSQAEQSDKNGGGVYIENGLCTMDNVLVVECTAGVGGAVYVNEGTFSISGDTRITPSDEQTAGKNDVYLKSGKVITVTDALNGTIPIARITPENYPTSSTSTVTVLGGTAANTEYTKFTVTDQAGPPSKKWKINASGALEAVGGQGPTIEATDWEDLRNKVQNAADGAVIEIANDITYEWTSMESTIKVKENITVKSSESNRYTLNAHGNGADGGTANYKVKSIFEVDSGKTLTLESVILTRTEKYAVYVAENSSLTMKNVTIKDCKSENNAAGIYFNKGKDLTLENCIIEKCKGKGGLSSGGINIQVPTGTVSIKDTTIENCEAKDNGGGMYLNNVANCTLEKVKIQKCSAANGGGIYNSGGNLILKKCSIGDDASDSGNTAKKGGGVYLKNVVTLTMQNVTVTNNKALTQGGGIYLADGELKIPGGNTIADNSITAIGNSQAGGGIYVAKGKLRLSGGSISGNSAAANKGGGVYLKTGTFIMTAGEIKNCSAKFGGGVGLAGTSSFTMTGGSITGCHADVDDGQGGGIYTELNTTLTLQGENADNPVLISNCTAKKAGGGMLIHTDNQVTVKNAHIEENSANSGGGVYLDKGTFTIAGSTRITPSGTTAGQNDVFLKEEKFITISDSLTAETPIARITPENYKNGVQVLQAFSTNDYTKFTVTPNSEGSWQVESNGTLKKQ